MNGSVDPVPVGFGLHVGNLSGREHPADVGTEIRLGRVDTDDDLVGNARKKGLVEFVEGDFFHLWMGKLGYIC